MKNDNQIIKTGQGDIRYIPSSAESLIAQAIEKGTPVDTMERLLVMRRELRAEHAKELFDQAMANFQAQCPTIEKTKQAFNYKYAPLESIVEQVKGLLAINGFSYTFDTEDEENAIVVTCLVKHIAGHSEVSRTTIHRETTTKMNASQQSGAAMTYGKRYAFCNAFGILTGDEDTDGTSSEKTVKHSPVVDNDGFKREPYQSTAGVKQGAAIKANTADGACPSCHAPKGRLHATKCVNA